MLFFNKSCEEYIRSIFHNRQNQSVIIVSVTSKDDCNSLKCRSVPITSIKQAFADNAVAKTKNEEQPASILMRGSSFKGTKLFKDFCLRWPDFIEFDELNSKIITKHSTEDAYRVWSLCTY